MRFGKLLIPVKLDAMRFEASRVATTIDLTARYVSCTTTHMSAMVLGQCCIIFVCIALGNSTGNPVKFGDFIFLKGIGTHEALYCT